MLDEEKLVELLVRRDDLLEQGHDATPEEVCVACPELIEQYKARLESLKKTDWLFETKESEDDESFTTPGAATVALDAPDLPTSSLSIEQFLRAITESGLMTAEEIDAFRQSVSADTASDTSSFARELIQRQKLTPYQASVLLSERSDPLLLDRYVILDTIDGGGMGIVFKALHRSMDRVVALKTLPPSALDSAEKIRRFQREVKAAAMLSHPNIVITHDAHEANGVHFLVMEYVKGKDLGKVVRAQGPLPIATAVDYLLQAARGLEHAHAQGIIHRDIKPGNLLLDPDGTVKVLDLGLARLEVSNERPVTTEDELTADGGVMGTAAYMSPEQGVNTHNADARSDIYSLGCALYYLLTGKPPYKEDSYVSTILAHRDKPIPPLSEKRNDVPEDVIAVYRRMMAKKPEDRYQSMAEVTEALSDCATNRPETTSDSFPMARHESQDSAETAIKRRRTKAWWWSLAICAVAIVLLMIVFLPKVYHADQADEANPKATSQNPPPLAIAPFTSQEAKQHQRAWAKYLGVPVEFKNSIGMKMVLIPPGEFLMGSTEEEIAEAFSNFTPIRASVTKKENSFESEGPRHKVTITKPFYLAAYETTVGQFGSFVDATGYKTEAEVNDEGGFGTAGDQGWKQGTQFHWRNPGYPVTTESPVTNVSWNDAVAFCQWMSDVGGKERKYDLPTEAQWEYGCRAGSTTRWCFGDNASELKEFARCSGSSPAAVGMKLPNSFGICDMHGNVREWCRDWYSLSYYKTCPKYNPAGPRSGRERVLRGGSWLIDLTSLTRSSARNARPPDKCHLNIGFRVVLLIDDKDRLAVSNLLPSGPDPLHMSDDRSVAEWVLEIGGKVSVLVDDEETAIQDLVYLPERFHLASIDLEGIASVTDDDLSKLSNLQNLDRLCLSNTPISNAAVERLRNLESLRELFLDETPVTDDALSHLYALHNLELLSCQNTAISDTGMNHLRRLRKLRDLYLGKTDITSAGISSLESLRNLKRLNLSQLQIGDEAMPVIGRMTSLTRLWLFMTNVTDSGLHHLTQLSELRELCLMGTDVSAAGVAELQRSIPACNILVSDEIRSAVDAMRRNGSPTPSSQRTPVSSSEREAKSASEDTAPPLAIAPFTEEEAKQHQQAWADYLGVPIEMENSIGMKMALIPPGEFQMGAAEEEVEELSPFLEENTYGLSERVPGCVPQHKVTITHPFYIGVYEVTVGEFSEFVESVGYLTDAEQSRLGGSTASVEDNVLKPRWGKDVTWKYMDYEQTDQHPVGGMSWNDATAFCRWLSKKEDESYLLPTEAQWEFACRAGTTGQWYSETSVSNLSIYAVFSTNRIMACPQRVGSKLPNNFELFDTLGNALEWCADRYSSDYYRVAPEADPTGPESGDLRTLRGGAWQLGPQNNLTWLRFPSKPDGAVYANGFRIIRKIDLQP